MTGLTRCGVWLGRSRLCRCCAGSALSIALAGGCIEGRAYERGRKAEERGEINFAYDYYCRAAADNPGSGTLASAIARVRPGASAYWESQALLELDAGNYDEAWRLLMRALEIQPDSATTARLIRQIQTQHADQIAVTRQDWLRRGAPVLAAAARQRRREVPDVGEDFDSGPTVSTQPAVSSLIAIASATGRVSSSASPLQSDPLDAPDVTPATPPAASPSERRAAEAAVASKSPTPPAKASSDEESQPAEPGNPEADLEPEPIKSADEEAPAAKPSRPRIRPSRGEFLTIQTLSLKDRAYPKTTSVMDEVEVRLRDTDASLEADFDLYSGRARIKKIRDMKIGRSQVFSGASGRIYRFTLLGIHHKTHTVRFGIKPA